MNCSKTAYSNLSIDNYQGFVRPNLYDRPVLKLWELFSDYGGLDTAIQFLHDYYKEYSFKEVDTKEFVRFTKVYFNLKDDTYFQDWLKLD